MIAWRRTGFSFENKEECVTLGKGHKRFLSLYPFGGMAMESQFGKHFMETLRNILTLSDPPPIAPSPAGLEPSEISPPRASRTGLVPGHFHSSEFLIELKIQDVVHTGYPKVCLVDRSTGTERWGSPLDWSWPNPNQRRVAWVDNEQRGLTQRTLARAEDALGAEGS